jgi:hypothetical protein
MHKIPPRLIIVLLLVQIIGMGCQSNNILPMPTEVIVPTPTPFAATATATSAPVPFDSNLIKIAWFYKPPAEELYAMVSRNFKFFILTNHDEPEREKMRAAGLTAPIYQYLLLAEIQDPGSCTEIPWGNQVANRPGDFCDISINHPDWFLLDESGQRIHYEGDFYCMDPGNPGFRAFWLERAREIQTEYKWDGLFIDNVEASLLKYKDMSVRPEKYANDSSFELAVDEFLKYLNDNYFAPENRPVIANIIYANDPQVWYRYLQYLDGAMLENFAVDWQGYFSREDWEKQMSLISTTQDMGKTALLVSQGAQDDISRQEFSFASYLLIANGQSSFRYANHSAYTEVWWYSNYEVDLGAPLGNMRQEAGQWVRDFEHGQVIVNPSNHTAEIVVKP